MFKNDNRKNRLPDMQRLIPALEWELYFDKLVQILREWLTQLLREVLPYQYFLQFHFAWYLDLSPPVLSFCFLDCLFGFAALDESGPPPSQPDPDPSACLAVRALAAVSAQWQRQRQLQNTAAALTGSTVTVQHPGSSRLLSGALPCFVDGGLPTGRYTCGGR